MRKIYMFMADPRESETSIVNRTVMGLLLGIALGWVLLRYRKPAGISQTSTLGSSSNKEIEIPIPSEDDPLNFPELTHSDVEAQDRLEAIKGIGPVFAKRLNSAGVFTYRQLSNQDPEQLVEIVKARPGQIEEIKGWITQADILCNKAA